MNTTMIDLFAWLDDADASIGPDSTVVHDTYWDYYRASQAFDDEGVRASRVTFEQLAAAHDLPWLGVFGRHWELQFRLCRQREGASAVADAVSAFEVAHREENMDCPQTICAAQDLAIAYSQADAPGYSGEIIAACRDTLARIDPTWPCFDCVSAELRDGLFSAGHYDATLELIEEVEVEIRRAGAKPTLSYPQTRLEVLLEQGRNGEALALVESLVHDRFAVHDSELARPSFDLDAARALVRAGEVARASAIFEATPDPVARPSLARKWVLLADELLLAGHLANGDAVAAKKVAIANLLFQRGSHRHAFDVAISSALWAARRGARSAAQRSRRLAETIAPELAKPLDAPDRLVEVADAMSKMPVDVAATAPIDLRVERFERKRRDGSLDLEELTQLADLLTTQGWIADAHELLWERVRELPEDLDSARVLFGQLLADRDDAGAASVADRVMAVSRLDGLILHAHNDAAHERWSACAERCRQIVEAEPTAVNTRRMWALAEREMGAFGEAARLSGELLDLVADDSPQDWWAAVVNGSLSGDWALVRRAGESLGMAFESAEGPIDELWEVCDITFLDDDGVERTHVAQRTGPATARIVTVARPSMVQRVNDVVVFEPRPLDPGPDEAAAAVADDDDDDDAGATGSDESGAARAWRYGAIVTTESAGYRSFLVEGVLPDRPEAWASIRDALQEVGNPIWMFGQYDVIGVDGNEVLVFEAAVALQPEGDARALAQLLTELTAGWDAPPAWPDLAAEADLDVDEHQARSLALWDDDI